MHLSTAWKKRIARWLQFRLLQRFMVWGIYLIIPRHRVGVNIVAFNKAGEVLLLKHVFHPQAPWGLPGGWLGRGEVPAVGALRELQEETGLTAQLGPVLLATRETDVSCIGIIYLAYLQPDKMTLSDEILEARWFAPDALPKPLTASTVNAIEKAVFYQQNPPVDVIEVKEFL